MRARIDLTGLRFGRLAVVSYSHSDDRHRSFWLCKCDCGRNAIVMVSSLRTGNTTSCGCRSREALASSSGNLKHGGTGSGAYASWTSAKSRCFYPGNINFKRYGGAGVTMCDLWRDSFAAFFADMGERPPGTTLDRYPNREGHYEPGNCRWATDLEQAANRRPGSSQRHRRSKSC